MSASLKELKDQRMALVKTARDILDAAKRENREFTDAERETLDKSDAEVERLSVEIDRGEEDARRHSLAARYEQLLQAPTPAPVPQPTPVPPAAPQRQRLAPQATPEYHADFCRYLVTGNRSERLSMMTDDSPRGGYTVVSEQFVAELIKNIDDQVDIRRLARKFRVTGAVSMVAPTRTAVADTFNWSQEVQTTSADDSLRFGQRRLTPHYLAGEIIVSRDLLRMSALNPEMLVREELARDAAEAEEAAFLTGSGAQQPLGLFTASADGISNARDVSTGNTTTTIQSDNLIECLYNLKSTYQARATWLFHRTALKQIRKLKTGDGQYLWAPGLTPGQPDSILGRPVVMSEWAPSTFTTGLYVGIVGDFQWYWIVDALDMEIVRADELLVRTNQVTFVSRLKTDGAPVKAEAFTRVTLA